MQVVLQAERVKKAEVEKMRTTFDDRGRVVAVVGFMWGQQECWSGLPFPSPGDLPDPGIEPGSLALQADSLLSEPSGKPRQILTCW